MTGAEDFALERELVAQADIQPIRQHDQPGGHGFAGRGRDGLPLGPGGKRGRLRHDEADIGRNFRAHRVDERRVENAFLVARPLLNQAAEAGDPGYAVGRGGAQHGVGNPGLLQDGDLIAVELFAAEVGRIFGAGIDQHDVDPGAPEHRGRQRAGEPAADDGDIGHVHGGRRGGRVPFQH